MKASTVVLSLFVLAYLIGGLSAAEVRTWTDSSGQTLSGSLEKVTDDGKVQIKSNGQTFTIPIERFSDKDQAYIDSHKDDLKEDDAPDRRRRKSDLFDYRQWKDNQDNEIKAKYVRIFEGQVVLLQGRTAHKVSFYDLSDEDQVYLRGELEARNEADQIPPPPVGGLAGGPNPIAGGNQAYNPRMGNIAAPPAYAPPAMDDFAKKQQEEHERMRREIEKQQEEARRRAEEAAREREENERRRQQEQEQRIQEQNQRLEQQRQDRLARMNAPMGGPNMEMQYEEYKVCSNCNKRIDSNIGAGDRCPHCNVFFASEQDRFGRTTKKVPVPWYYGAPIPIGLIVWVVVAVFRKLGGS